MVNQRTDEWGGTLENRARLLLDIVRTVRRVVDPTFTVAVKLNSADFQRGGFDSDDAAQVIAMLAPLGVDVVELSGGSYEAPAMTGQGPDDRTLAREAYSDSCRGTGRGQPGAVDVDRRCGSATCCRAGPGERCGFGRHGQCVGDRSRSAESVAPRCRSLRRISPGDHQGQGHGVGGEHGSRATAASTIRPRQVHAADGQPCGRTIERAAAAAPRAPAVSPLVTAPHPSIG
ncbi:hypothetical protein ACETU7_21400 [Rhodococcus sp. 3Y1]